MTGTPSFPAAPSAWETADGREVGLLTLLYDAAWQVRLGAGIVAVGAGAAVLTWPGATRLVVGVEFGIYLLSLGVLRLTGGARSPAPAARQALTSVTGASAVALGVVCLLDPHRSVLLLIWWTGCGWLLGGVGRIVAARRTPGLRRRRWRTAAGTSSVAAGALLLAFPVASVNVLTTAAGGWLIAVGCAEALHGVVRRYRLPTGSPDHTL
ncbi:HdeD family acid-resistance protein [Streptomyces shenzhenensis]|uniref:HdeD family acid-resistance protein n=1 Tax=Streptomyces shenzhenensis TaxID=943815 RepID=UPI0033F80EF5